MTSGLGRGGGGKFGSGGIGTSSGDSGGSGTSGALAAAQAAEALELEVGTVAMAEAADTDVVVATAPSMFAESAIEACCMTAVSEAFVADVDPRTMDTSREPKDGDAAYGSAWDMAVTSDPDERGEASATFCEMAVTREPIERGVHKEIDALRAERGVVALGNPRSCLCATPAGASVTQA